MPPIRQYVNVDPTKAAGYGLAVDRAGRNVTVRANVADAGADVAVHFELIQWRDGMVRSNRRRTSQTSGTGVATAEFKVSAYGGDLFDVNCSLDEGSPATFDDGRSAKLAAQFEVWRLIYYQVSFFNADLALGLPAVPTLPMDPVIAELARHHVELRPGTGGGGVAHQGAITGSAALRACAREAYDDRHEPLSVILVMIDQLADNDTVTFTGNAGADAMGALYLQRRLWQVGAALNAPDWLVKLEWRWRGDWSWTTIADEGTPALMAGAVAANPGLFADIHVLQITRPRAVVDRGDGRWQFRIKVRFYKSVTAGLSANSTGATWITERWMNGRNFGVYADNMRQEVATHEIGHAIGMVKSGQRTIYTRHGHTGPHCSQGLGAVDLARDSYRGLPAATCVMFGNVAAAPRVQFCDDCSTSIKALPIDDLGELPGHGCWAWML